MNLVGKVFKRTTGWVACALLLTFPLLAQELRRRAPPLAVCPPTVLRFTVRDAEGQPVSGLRVQDLLVEFDGSPAAVVALESGEPRGPHKIDTDILFVVPPLSGLDKSSVTGIIRAMERADNFLYNGAVLSPDGVLSPFSTNPAEIGTVLLGAISGSVHAMPRSQWPHAEEQAFLILRRLPGRHVILDLTNPANLFRSTAKGLYRRDQTLDYLSSLDMAQIYSLVEPVTLSSIIPMGDASTLHVDIGPQNHSQKQLQEVQHTSERQDWVTSQKQLRTATGGRRESSLDALFEGILEDALGSYVVKIQATTACRPGDFYSVSVSAQRSDVRVFAPRALQMLPFSLPAP